VPDASTGPLASLQQQQRTFNFTFGKLVLEQRWGSGGTGTAAWAASTVLAFLLSRGPGHLVAELPGSLVEGLGAIATTTSWHGIRALELGAGLGLVSLAAARLGMRVTATDGDPAAIPLLRMNVVRNRVDAGSIESCPTRDGTVGVAHVRWGNTTGLPKLCGGSSSDPYPDVILAADVVYGNDIQVWKALLVTMREIIGPRSLLLLAQTRRYQDEDAFFELLRRRFHCSRLPQAALGEFGVRKTATGETLFSITACTGRAGSTRPGSTSPAG